MSKVMTEETGSTKKKLVTRLLIGGVFGYAFAAGAVELVGAGLLDAMGPSRVALATVGLVYALMAVFVGFGVAAPRAGAALLNVGDAEELREERGTMLRSVVTMGGMGLGLVLLALARGTDFAAGPIPASVAMVAVLALIIGYLVASWRWDADELNRQLALESCFWAFGLSWAGLTLWASADFLGFGPALTPIDVVATLSAMMLVGAFIAIGRRGMMVR